MSITSFFFPSNSFFKASDSDNSPSAPFSPADFWSAFPPFASVEAYLWNNRGAKGFANCGVLGSCLDRGDEDIERMEAAGFAAWHCRSSVFRNMMCGVNGLL